LEYYILSFWAGILCLFITIIIRLELETCEPFINTDQVFNSIITSHAFLIIIFTVISFIIGGFGNFLVPTWDSRYSIPTYKWYKILISIFYINITNYKKLYRNRSWNRMNSLPLFKCKYLSYWYFYWLNYVFSTYCRHY